MNLLDRLSHHRPLIEPLEQRIAPALLVTGGNLLGGPGNPTSGQGSIGGNTVTRVQVLSGEAIVWYNHGAIDAISVGPNTSLDIWGDVGAIIGNLTASGKLSDSDNNPSNGLDGDVLLPNNILGITTHPLGYDLGSVQTIITGGSISNLNISGDLGYAPNNPIVQGDPSAVYAGSGAWHSGNSVKIYTGLDLNPIMPGFQGTFTFAPSNAKTVTPGASITNVVMGAADQLQMFAGNGATGTAGTPGHPGTPGTAGGSISNITIENAFINIGTNALTPSYYLLAGSGGNGSSGGRGGSIGKVNEITSVGLVDVIAGGGGTGLSGPGGGGGSVNGLNMQSVSSAYTIHAGNGGSGAPGGAGGSVKGVNFGGNLLSSGIVVAAPFTGGGVDDILLVDSQSGNMVIEQNDGNGTGFTPVIQDSVTLLTTIAPVGQDPVSAIAVDLGNGLQDIVVAYKTSENVGVYINQGGGVFYQLQYSNGIYAGDSVEATSIPLPVNYMPTLVAGGNFNGYSVAVLADNVGTTELLALSGNYMGMQLSTFATVLPADPVSLVTATIQGNGFNDLFVGFKSGLIDPLLNTGAVNGPAFNVGSSGIVIPGGILNLDYNPQYNGGEGLLLALNGTGTAMTTYVSNVGGVLTQVADIPLTAMPGTALVAHFVPEQQSSNEPIEVLTSVTTGSRLDYWTAQGASFVLTSSVGSSEVFSNFAPVVEGNTFGVAAVGGALEHFAFSQNGGHFFDVGLPFNGKKVSLTAGNGGDGVNTITDVAAGGAGGVVTGMNVMAGDIVMTAGNGGSSENAAAGAGGVVTDSPVLVTITGESLPTIIEADFSLAINGGTGGTASGTLHAGAGGSGGAVLGLDVSMLEGTTQIYAGNGGDSDTVGGAGGSGGAVTALKSVNNGGDLIVGAGDGGMAMGATGNGGAGGSIFNLNHTLALTNQSIEAAYNVDLTGGTGGASAAGLGGIGGSVSNLIMSLQPSNESVTNIYAIPPTGHTPQDSTLRVVVTAGNGGNGTKGGAGGSVRNVNENTVYDQLVTVIGLTAAGTYTFPEVNPVVASFTAGNGGIGSKGAGGMGGSVTNLTLLGISHYDLDSEDLQAGDAPLVITSGNGGNGSTVGGAGGAILGIVSENAQFVIPGSGGTGGVGSGTNNSYYNLTKTELSGATITSGHGGNGGTGNGGAGGGIAALSVGVSGFDQVSVVTFGGQDIFSGGQMLVQSGAGGNSAAARGGAAGSITNSTVGCADAFDIYGLMLQGGTGGSGALAGGTGGNVTNIQLNSPENPTPGSGNAFDVLSTLILAGNGGNVTGQTAVGGTGGSVSQIIETKDVGSAINIIQAGNGGNAVATGGLGGSVTGVNTVGLIGQASDEFGFKFGAFETFADSVYFSGLFPAGIPEGVFAGRGGTGATAGLAGSVTAIQAAQIAAIGAAANAGGLFAAAQKVANINAEVIGYDVNGNGLYDNVTGTNMTSPAVAEPIDGFLFSVTAATGIVTSNPTLLQGFTFIG